VGESRSKHKYAINVAARKLRVNQRHPYIYATEICILLTFHLRNTTLLHCSKGVQFHSAQKRYCIRGKRYDDMIECLPVLMRFVNDDVLQILDYSSPVLVLYIHIYTNIFVSEDSEVCQSGSF
jgi:hypothetical protein